MYLTYSSNDVPVANYYLFNLFKVYCLTHSDPYAHTIVYFQWGDCTAGLFQTVVTVRLQNFVLLWIRLFIYFFFFILGRTQNKKLDFKPWQEWIDQGLGV